MEYTGLMAWQRAGIPPSGLTLWCIAPVKNTASYLIRGLGVPETDHQLVASDANNFEFD